MMANPCARTAKIGTPEGDQLCRENMLTFQIDAKRQGILPCPTCGWPTMLSLCPVCNEMQNAIRTHADLMAAHEQWERDSARLALLKRQIMDGDWEPPGQWPGQHS